MLLKIARQYSSSVWKPFLMLALFMGAGVASVFGAGPPPVSAMNNVLTWTLVILILILLVAIFLLGHILLGLAESVHQKRKNEKSKSAPATAVVTGLLLFLSFSGMAQGNPETMQSAVAIQKTYGGLSAFTFYAMITIVFVELLVILTLLFNIKTLLKDQKKTSKESVVSQKSSLGYWWNLLNRFKPVEQEADLALDHEYDGIRELDNRLPPWWLYGFYITIIIGVIYFWRYHVSYSAPLSKEEYEISLKKADAEVKAYLAKKGETVDENTVTVSKDAADLSEGKKIYATACVACHKADGGGMVGPNLTDDYWLHGGDIKSVFKTIKYGINAMPQWQTSYSNKQIAQVASYVMSLHGTQPPGAKEAEGELYKNDDAAGAAAEH